MVTQRSTAQLPLSGRAISSDSCRLAIVVPAVGCSAQLSVAAVPVVTCAWFAGEKKMTEGVAAGVQITSPGSK